MTDKHIVKVRMLGACVIITVPAAVREVTGIESGDYVYVETNGKRGFTITKGALAVKKKVTAKKVAKPAPKKKVLPPKKKVAKPAPAPKKKVAAAKPAPKKLIAPPVKKKIIAPKMPSPQLSAADLPMSMPSDSMAEE